MYTCYLARLLSSTHVINRKLDIHIPSEGYIEYLHCLDSRPAFYIPQVFMCLLQNVFCESGVLFVDFEHITEKGACSHLLNTHERYFANFVLYTNTNTECLIVPLTH